MKINKKYQFTVVLCILACFLYTVINLTTDSSSEGHIIHRESISTPSPKPRVIPRIIHHTWIDEDIPLKWQYSYNECKQKYSDYEFQLWTDKRSRDFISDEYPEFLEMFDGYSYPIQRADAIRYFVLYKYGGVYMDLDIGCADISLDTLMTYDAVIPQTKPFGFSNDMLASKPGHEFFGQLINQMPKWDHWYVLPYLTVFCSTGPLFLTIQHYYYQKADLIWILDVDLYSDGASKLFKHYEGSTWHSWDAYIVKLIWRYALELAFLCLFAISLFIRFRRYKSKRLIKINEFSD